MMELFVVEYPSGSMVDATGDGGFTVWATRAQAQDAMDSHACGEDSKDLVIVRFIREPAEEVTKSK